MEFSIQIEILLFLVATLAGWVDTIAGGGGLITIPTMLILGIPPSVALATNKLQGSSGTLVASLYFIRKGIVNLNNSKLLLFTTFIGSVLGGRMLLFINSEVLRGVIPILLILMGLYFLFSQNIGIVDRKPRISYISFSVFVAPILGFYDGFFGTGTGTFMTLAFVSLCGYNLSKSTANAKILNFTSNFSALIYFVFFGEIYWKIGIFMIAGQIIGSSIAAKMILEKGTALIRPVVVSVCFLMSAKLLFEFLKSQFF
jgi:uncharacterized membrane protein YfcA